MRAIYFRLHDIPADNQVPIFAAPQAADATRVIRFTDDLLSLVPQPDGPRPLQGVLDRRTMLARAAVPDDDLAHVSAAAVPPYRRTIHDTRDDTDSFYADIGW